MSGDGLPDDLRRDGAGSADPLVEAVEERYHRLVLTVVVPEDDLIDAMAILDRTEAELGRELRDPTFWLDASRQRS